MKGSNIRRAELGDAENIRQLYQASIRSLGSSHYNPEQIDRWTNRPIEAFAQDIQNTLVLVCEFENRTIGYAQIDLQAASVPAVYVHPGYARRNVGSLLFCFLEGEASSAELPRLSANVSLNAVEFFRAHRYAELGSTLIPLADGTSLLGVKMERRFFEKIEFASDQSLTDRVLTSLRCDHAPSRSRALRMLKQQSPAEVLDALIAFLDHPEEAVRRRAGSALTQYSVLRGEPVNVELRADTLAQFLRHGEDPRVRMCCAIALLSAKGSVVDQAYMDALRDPEPRVAELACIEVGQRGGPDGTAALFGMLTHPNWRVRLQACEALITQKTADQRVVSTLDAMSREPEAAAYDAEVDEYKESLEEFVKEFTPEGTAVENCGKLGTILAKARRVANERSA